MSNLIKILISAISVLAADVDVKFTDLTSITTPATNAVLALADPTVTPSSRKITVANFAATLWNRHVTNTDGLIDIAKTNGLLYLNLDPTVVDETELAAGVAGFVRTNNGSHWITATGSTASRTAQERAAEVINVRDFATPQLALSAAMLKTNGVVVNFPPYQAYSVNDDGYRITNGMNMVINLNGCTFTQQATTNNTHNVWWMTGTNIVFNGDGARLIGYRAVPLASTNGENGIVVSVRNSRDITFRDLEGRDGMHDIFYLGGSQGSYGIYMENVRMTNARRNNMTITHGGNHTFMFCRFSGANGTAPEAGVDEEPDNGRSQDNKYFACLFDGNAGPGLNLNKGGGLSVDGTRIIGCTFSNNVESGVSLIGASDVASIGSRYIGNGFGIYAQDYTNFTVNGGSSSSNTIDGIASFYGTNITISGVQVIGNASRGIRLRNSSATMTEGATVSGNIIAWNEADGILGQYLTLANISGNSIYANGTHGISLEDSTGGVIGPNLISGNSRSASATYHGVRISGNHNSILWNTTLDSTRWAEGLAQSATSNTVTLADYSSALDDFYNGMVFVVQAGTASGETNVITDYVGATKVATFSSAFGVTPDATSRYFIRNNYWRPDKDIYIASGAFNFIAVSSPNFYGPDITDLGQFTQIFDPMRITTTNITDETITAADLGPDSVGASELNGAAVEAEMEGVMDLQDMQGAVTDGQVPNNITIDLATTATTANAGDSATAFFSSGTIEEARLPSTIATDAEVAATYLPKAGIPCMAFSVTDETTAITTGNAKRTIRAPFAFTITSIRAQLSTASSSGAVQVDINESGSTIFSTPITIDQSEKTTQTAATANVVSDTAIANDAELTIDIDGAGTGATGLKIVIYGTP